MKDLLDQKKTKLAAVNNKTNKSGDNTTPVENTPQPVEKEGSPEFADGTKNSEDELIESDVSNEQVASNEQRGTHFSDISDVLDETVEHCKKESVCKVDTGKGDASNSEMKVTDNICDTAVEQNTEDTKQEQVTSSEDGRMSTNISNETSEVTEPEKEN